MCDTRKRKLTAFLISALVLVLVSMVFTAIDRSMDSSQYAKIVSSRPPVSAYKYRDLSDDLLFMGQPAAIDRETSTIYIPLDLQSSANVLDLLRQLRLKVSGSQLYFLQDPYLEDLDQAVRDSHPFPLLIADRLSRYMEYQVIFTGLPVISLTGLQSDMDPEEGREIFTGEIMIWAPQSSQNGLSHLELSKLQWHERGKTAATHEKKPLKLNLLKSNGKKRQLDLLGLGEEDDWILNPMNMDDTKIREKLFMDLWNENAAREGSLPMSQGKYVELILNGRYQGLYLLQRRVDGKYLEISDSDVLLKGTDLYINDVRQDHYDLISGPEQGLQLMDSFLSGTQPQMLVSQDLIRLNLFLQFAAGQDNMECKNIFYLFRNTLDSPTLTLLPWDTDMSFGLLWNGREFSYDPDSWSHSPVSRPETAQLLTVFPGYEKQAAEDWAVLREGILSEKSIQSQIQKLRNQLEHSGTLVRDQNMWSLRYQGEDSIPALEKWILNRLAFLDQYYRYQIS